jgi:hypothetical protein
MAESPGANRNHNAKHVRQHALNKVPVDVPGKQIVDVFVFAVG